MEIAERLGDGVLRAQYMKVAETYLRLTEIELRGVETGIAIEPARTPLRPEADREN